MQNTNTTQYLYRADGVKLRKTYTLVNNLGTKIINTEYLDGFQYSTPNTEPIRRALEEQDDATISATRAGNEEAFLPPEERPIAPGNPPATAMMLSFFPTAEGYYDYENLRYIYQYKDHLGNVRLSYVKEGGTLKVMDSNDYYPFGLSFMKPAGGASQYDPLAVPYNYKYNGKELQETGMYDYGARFYMPDIGRWGVVDPLAEKYPSVSPYVYTLNNPIKYIDPDGRRVAPIFGTDGSFLGTDDQGLEGRAIVMNKENFTQGMSHEDALTFSTYIPGKSANYGFESKEAFNKYANTYLNLKNRPDYDGFVGINEGIDWAKLHPGALDRSNPLEALYLDSSKLDFGNLKASDLVEGVQGNINLFDFTDFTSSKSRATTYALGNTQMKLLNAKSGSVKLFSDDYDWDYHDKSYKESITPPNSTRDRLIWGERKRAGLNDSHGFKVHMYGTGTLRK